MDGYAIRTLKCPKYLHEIDEPSVQAFLGKFVVVYFDDILVFSKDQEENFEHLRQVIAILEQEKLYGNLTKCLSSPLKWCFWAT